jgi:alkylhydroperoxidase family enzyme
MDSFVLHASETAKGDASKVLAGITDKLGFAPNMFAIMGGAPAALGGFVALNRHLTTSSLTALEREVIQTAASMENQSPYCVAGLTAFANIQKLDAETIQTVCRNDQVEDRKLEAL